MPDVFALLPALRPCLTCGGTVLVRLWHHATTETTPWWEELADAREPVLGQAHPCLVVVEVPHAAQ